MRVLITGPSLDVKDNVSGISSVVNTIINHNPGINYTHFLIGKKDKEKANLGRIIPVIKSYYLLIKASRNNEYNILHLNLALNGKSLIRDYVIFKIAALFKKKIIVHLHGGKYLIKKPAKKLLVTLITNVLTNCDKIIVLSEHEKEVVGSIYGMKEIEVLPNTVERVFLNSSVEENVDELQFLFLGRLNESKGLELIIKAFNNYIKLGFKGRLNICGTGPLEQLVIESTKINPKILFHGIVYGEQKLSHITSNHIFLLPSLHGEGLPVALLESMAVGLVPIVTNDGSMGLAVADTVNGFVVPKNNVDALIEKMTYLASDINAFKKMSSNAKGYIAANFNVDNYIEKLNAIYNAIA